MNMYVFARLTAFVQYLRDNNSGLLTDFDIKHMNDICKDMMPEPQPQTHAKTNIAELNDLLYLMQQGTQKIEAIKAYRNLTGAMLKEAKDAVEKHWVSKPVSYLPKSPEDEATIGDILKKATGQ